ncbi:DNA glycosylase [Thiomicrospira aerophila AL3]|uniref:DNA glycosylase n=1 Tax=Thiomicrospira aerophila AL3 TaxID=717772 RepID=W0DUI2_9GAMM|nr:DNA-deoxyinosine glycosylase [Thiomicrospira aerophila]AHF00943.1 DNA glycosylase [Thiomicrospira aerophila AL3]
MHCHSLAPVLPKPAAMRVLILGSMPGEASLQAQAYYAHPRNQFWPILAQCLGVANWPDHLPARYQYLAEQGIGLWDVIAQCQRQGSLDSAIKADSISLNPILLLLEQQPNCQLIVCNGQKAGQLFKRYLAASLIENFPNIEWCVMPSTSPAYAALSFVDKYQAWQDKLINFR